jgi:hypothetical protein
MLAGKLVLLGLAFLLAAQMPFSPIPFTSHIHENGEKCEVRVFGAMGTRGKQQDY